MNSYNLPTLLHTIYRREALSFLQYVAQISPYASEADKPLLARLHELAASEQRELESLGLYMEKARYMVPHTGAFPSVFSNYNFVNVRKLIPLIVEDHQAALVRLEADAQSVSGDATAPVQKLLAIKRQHLTELQKLLG